MTVEKFRERMRSINVRLIQLMHDLDTLSDEGLGPETAVLVSAAGNAADAAVQLTNCAFRGCRGQENTP